MMTSCAQEQNNSKSRDREKLEVESVSTSDPSSLSPYGFILGMMIEE